MISGTWEFKFSRPPNSKLCTVVPGLPKPTWPIQRRISGMRSRLTQSRVYAKRNLRGKLSLVPSRGISDGYGCGWHGWIKSVSLHVTFRHLDDARLQIGYQAYSFHLASLEHARAGAERSNERIFHGTQPISETRDDPKMRRIPKWEHCFPTVGGKKRSFRVRVHTVFASSWDLPCGGPRTATAMTQPLDFFVPHKEAVDSLAETKGIDDEIRYLLAVAFCLCGMLLLFLVKDWPVFYMSCTGNQKGYETVNPLLFSLEKSANKDDIWA